MAPRGIALLHVRMPEPPPHHLPILRRAAIGHAHPAATVPAGARMIPDPSAIYRHSLSWWETHPWGDWWLPEVAQSPIVSETLVHHKEDPWETRTINLSCNLNLGQPRGHPGRWQGGYHCKWHRSFRAMPAILRSMEAIVMAHLNEAHANLTPAARRAFAEGVGRSVRSV